MNNIIKTINVNYVDNKINGFIDFKKENRKIPVIIHKYNYIKEFLSDVNKMSESKKIDFFINISDRSLVFILKAVFYSLYKVNYFLFCLISEYSLHRGYSKIKNDIKFDKKFTDQELEEFALLIGKDFTDRQITECLKLKKGIVIEHWRQLTKIRALRNKMSNY